MFLSTVHSQDFFQNFCAASAMFIFLLDYYITGEFRFWYDYLINTNYNNKFHILLLVTMDLDFHIEAEF